jgi:SAM-dependent methyltransferase
LAEFTGERVIPGQVDTDLWNEHRARYMFASRFCCNKSVLDVGCGAGYGSDEMAQTASRVLGLDVSAEALQYARDHYRRTNLAFIRAPCDAMPIRDACFDLVVAFEVIEHLDDWENFLKEARRVLTPCGQLIISTPNKSYYAESRRQTGPNPFHEHEFEFEEFQGELSRFFPQVSLFLQNHSEGIVFQPVGTGSGAEVRIEGEGATPGESHFLIAVCAQAPQTGAPTFVYLPTSANVLREREVHIAKLEAELETKNRWLEQVRQEHQKLVEMFRAQQQDLEERNRWAEKLNAELEKARLKMDQSEAHLAAAIEQVKAGYEAKVAELEQENRAKTEWALETERRLGEELEQRSRELVKCVDVLHETEQTLEERTAWALSLDARLNAVAASRWVKLGRRIGLGPEARNR